MDFDPALRGFEPALRYAIQRIKDALVHYAVSKHWSSEDYYLVMAVNKKWGTISVEFLARAFERDKIERFEYLDEVMDFLENELNDQPEIYRSLGIILSPFDGHGIQEIRSFGEDLVEVDGDYLNTKNNPLRVVPGPIHS